MSYTKDLRDAALDRLKIAFPTFTTFRRSPFLQIQPEDLPCLSIYLLPEKGTPDGNANTGEPRFFHEAQIGISIAIAMSDPDAQEDALDAHFDTVMTTLLTDPSFVRLHEGTSGFDRSHHYGSTGSTNETPYGELRIRLGLTFRFDWPPNVPDDFKTIRVTTSFPANGTPDQKAATPQVVREYDIPQDE